MKKFISKLSIGFLLLSIMQLTFVPVVSAAPPDFGGGDGSITPYLIDDCGEIDYIDVSAHYLSSWYRLDADLTCENIPINASGEDYFSGEFDGNNHTITFTANETGQELPLGLFRYTDGAFIHDLNVAGTVTSDYGSVGGLVGYDYGSTLFENVSSSINVTGIGEAGGLIGYIGDDTEVDNASATGTVTGDHPGVGGLFGSVGSVSITNSYASGTVINTSNNTGGLIGSADGATIEDSYSTSTVTGVNNVGGLIGFDDGSTYTSVYATGDVTGDDYTGGLFGYAENSVIHDSFATGDVDGNDDVGGLVGKLYDAELLEVFATGDVDGNDNTGGLVGYLEYGIINNAYARGDVAGNLCVGGVIGNDDYHEMGDFKYTYSSGTITGATSVGGLAGCSDEEVQSSFWNSSIPGNPTLPFGIDEIGGYDPLYVYGKTAAELKDLDLYNDNELGEDFWYFAEFDLGEESIWTIDEEGVINDGYPYFGWSEEFLLAMDDTGPTVELINDDEITDDTATIYYDFDEVGSTYIEYGLTEEYGQTTGTVLTEEPYEEVYFVIAELEACTTYYYRLVATDESDNTAYSEGYFFTTTGCSSGSSSGSRTARTTDKNSTTSETFTDTGGHWAEEYIDEIAEKCNITGYKDANGNVIHKFGPDDEMLRAEFVEILTQCRFGDNLPVPTSKPFPDVNTTDWYAPALAKALSLGWISGYGTDGLFRPLQTISRAEATKILMLSEYSESELEDIEPTFPDISESDWYGKYVANAVKKGFMEGYANGNFGGDDRLLRGQAAKIISKLMQVYNN